MTKLEPHVLAQAIISAGYTPRPYSGRGMFGASCLACEAYNVYEALFKIGRELGVSGIMDDMPTAYKDTMGHEDIVYWPSVPFIQEQV